MDSVKMFRWTIKVENAWWFAFIPRHCTIDSGKGEVSGWVREDEVEKLKGILDEVGKPYEFLPLVPSEEYWKTFQKEAI